MSKIKQRQLNVAVPKILKVTFNNGTATRSTVTNPSGLIAVPGATGDTSYTAPADQDVDILFTMTQMVNPSGGTCRIYLTINNTAVDPGTYQEAATGSFNWPVQNVPYKYQLAAGATITIGAKWSMSAGTATITNNNTDSTYPNVIIGLVIPRIT
jgi:hypothetical protein